MSNFNNDFEIFNDDNLGSVRTALDEKRQVWFIAKDICDVLEIKNSRDALSRLDDDEKANVGITDTSSNGTTQNRNFNIINESGMYSLVLTSRKPQAKEFKRWLTHEVIPSIREHGGYIYNQEKLTDKDKTELNELVETLSEIADKRLSKNKELSQSLTKYKKRWHELIAEKDSLKSKTKQQKKEVKVLNDYASVQENMYDTLYEDFIKLYNENKQLKADVTNSSINNEEDIIHNKDTSASLNLFTKEPIFYINKEGLIISKEVFETDRENDDFER